MQLIRHLAAASDRPTSVAIGNFDGLHLGHQAVIGAMVSAAARQKAVPSVLTFEPHPRRFFTPDLPSFRLERLGTKLTRLQAAGVERVYMPRFDRAFAAMSAEEFLEGVLGRSLGAKVVVTGENFVFGKGRSGDVALLRQWGAANEVEILAVPYVMDGAKAYSSSAVRAALAEGDMPHVAQLLGRAYTLSGRVVHGDGRGAGIGFPTANVALPLVLKLPAWGVYAVRVRVDGVPYDGVANLGVKPTLTQNTRPNLEVHLFDCAADLYGTKMEVTFVERIRGEQKFDGLDALVAQIGRDCATARTLLGMTA